MTTLVPNRRGRHQEVTAQIAKHVEWPLHILHLETHVAYSIHRVRGAGIVETFRAVILAVFPHVDQAWIRRISVSDAKELLIQAYSALVWPLIHDENCSSFSESQLSGSVGQSGGKQIKFEFRDKVIRYFLRVRNVERNVV